MAVGLGTFERVVRAVAAALAPAGNHLTSDRAVAYFSTLGVAFPTASIVGNIATSLNAAAISLQALGQGVDAIDQAAAGADSDAVVTAAAAVLPTLASAFTALGTLGAAVALEPSGLFQQFGAGLRRSVIDDSSIRGLESFHPDALLALILLGVVDRVFIAADPNDATTVSHLRREFQLSKAAVALKNPKQSFQDSYGWGSTSPNYAALFSRIGSLLGLVGGTVDLAGLDDGTPAIFSSLVALRPNSSVTPPGIDIVPRFDVVDGLDFSFSPRPGLTVELTSQGDIASGATITVTPPAAVALTSASVSAEVKLLAMLKVVSATAGSDLTLFGETAGARLSAAALSVGVGLDLKAAGGPPKGELEVSAQLQGGRSVLKGGEGDGFLASLLPADGVSAPFDLQLRWTASNGLEVKGSGGVELVLPIHRTLGPITVDQLRLRLGIDGVAVVAGAGLTFAAKLGPVDVSVQDLGVGATLSFDQPNSNLGFANLALKFQPPTGVGIAIDSGPVSGGGFLSFESDIGRYSGAVALRVYDIAVQAIGIIETKFPDGHSGFSFLIIISAEFAPIQLGLGFTLLGVGGLIGINRSVNEDGLRAAVQSGSLDHVLFPKDVIANATSILHDLETLFPPTEGHYIFGPMAKIGWATPAIVEAELGVLLELPGPRIVLLGTATIIFPPGQNDSGKKLVVIRIDVAGVLDFPKKNFALDAHIHPDSNVVGFPLSGDMAMRLDWGQNANFAIAVGGFHKQFKPPAGFPSLRRITMDLGINGNPSASVKGYMAVTSNSAQVGARLDVHASGGGASLNGTIGFDALFVFSPFSFVASFDASVSISFLDIDFGRTIYGEISGPGPWRIKGSISVGVWWASATVSVTVTVGGEHKVELPPLDPWEGLGTDVPGLKSAIIAPANWSGTLPPGGHQAVNTVDVAGRSLVDPLGVASFRQKVLPLNFTISRFGGRKPTHNPPDAAKVVSLKVNGLDVTTKVAPVKDLFAPGQYKQMPDAEALSSPSYQQLDGGFSFSSDDIDVGAVTPATVTYKTIVLATPTLPPHPTPISFSPTASQVTSMVRRGATAFGGLRNAGTNRFVDLGTDVAFTLNDEVFALASKTTAVRYPGDVDGAYAVKASALGALPADVRANLQIVPAHELAS